MLLRRHERVINKAVEKAALNNVADDFSQHMNPPEEVEPVETSSYTKSAIQHLTTEELKELAAKERLENADDKTGVELKKELIEHFNL